MNRYDEVANRLYGIPLEATKFRIIAAFRAEKDIQLTSLNVSLLCPVNRQMILMPIRGRRCQHLQCFDLKSFMKMNEAKARLNKEHKWVCPVCVQPASLNDVEVDEYFRSILKKLRATSSPATEVELFRNGQWKERSLDIPTASKSKATCEVVTLSDDDQEPDVKPPKRIKMEPTATPPVRLRQPKQEYQRW